MKKVGCRSELYALSPSQQKAIRAHCERITLTEGIQWLEREFGLQVSTSALRVWLPHKRAERGQADVRKPSGTLNRLAVEPRNALFAFCEEHTLSEGVKWVQREFRLDVSQASLSRWLARQRATRGSKLDRKPQGNAPLALLSPEQKDLLFAACMSGTLDDGRKWVWENLGADISRSTICTWRNQERARRTEARERKAAC